MSAIVPVEKVRASKGAEWLWTVVVLVVGAATTLAAWSWERHSEAQRLNRELEYRAANLTGALRAEISRYERILAAARALHAATPSLTRENWRQFAASLEVAANYPAILAVGWQPRIDAAELPRFSAWAARQNGSFQVRPPAARDTYFPIVFVEPRTWRNERLVGLDNFVDPTRRAAMERARDQAGVTLTPPLTLTGDPDEKAKTAFLMMLPLYSGGRVPVALDERRRQHAGFVVVSFRLAELMNSVLSREFDGIDVHVRMRPEERLLFDSHPQAPGELAIEDRVAFGGQLFELGFHLTPEFVAAQTGHRSVLTLFTGLVITLLATVLSWTRTNALLRIERRAREIAADLSRSEERYSLAMDLTTDGIWEHDLATDVTRVSPRFEALLGYAAGSFARLGIEPGNLVHPSDRFRHRETIQNHLQHHTPYVVEVRMRGADGHYVWVHAHGRAQRDERGKAIRIFGAIADVSELHAALDRFRDLSRLASDWFWEQDAQYRFVSFSDSASPHPGIDRPATIGKTRWEVATGADAADMVAHRAAVEAHQSFREFEYRVLDDKGQVYWYSVNGRPLFDDNGRFTGYCGTSRDITERKRLEEELRAHRDNLTALVEAQTANLVLAKEAAENASRGKSEFLANMSHELRTPMHAILSFARIGRDKVVAAPPDKLREYFDRILMSGERLLDMVNSLLDLSKLEAGKMPLEFSVVDLAAVAHEVAADLEAMMEARRQRLEFIGGDGDAFVPGDPVRLSQVVRNLLSNALKFSPEGSRVTIEFAAAELPGGRRAEDAGSLPALRMVVADEGIGIPENELEAVFEKFYQSSKTRTGAGGTGLGLAICREIVEAHRGTIRAQNRPGGGAALETVLPRGVRG